VGNRFILQEDNAVHASAALNTRATENGT